MNVIETPHRPERIIVVILNWNGRDDTLACLESLRAVKYPNWEVLVVDNGSEDDSVEAIRKCSASSSMGPRRGWANADIRKP